MVATILHMQHNLDQISITMALDYGRFRTKSHELHGGQIREKFGVYKIVTEMSG